MAKIEELLKLTRQQGASDLHLMLTFEASINELVRKGMVAREDGPAFIGRRFRGKFPTARKG